MDAAGRKYRGGTLASPSADQLSTSERHWILNIPQEISGGSLRTADRSICLHHIRRRGAYFGSTLAATPAGQLLASENDRLFNIAQNANSKSLRTSIGPSFLVASEDERQIQSRTHAATPANQLFASERNWILITHRKRVRRS